MNLFVTDRNPKRAAAHLDDKRVIKIALEATQVLSTVLAERRITGFYRPTHSKHPITLWAQAQPLADAWTLAYGLALCDVYAGFAGREHACRPLLVCMGDFLPSLSAAPAAWQNSARRVDLGIDYSHLPITAAYRRYLCARWPSDTRPPVWTGRSRPTWATWSNDDGDQR